MYLRERGGGGRWAVGSPGLCGPRHGARAARGGVHEHPADVDRVDGGAVVGEHRGERAADDLRAVEDDGDLAVELVADGPRAVVSAEVLHDLDHGERRARQHALLARVVVDRPDVVVQRVPVAVVEALDVLLEADHVAQVVVDRPAEDGVVDDDAVHARLLVRRDHRRLDVDARDAPQLERDARLLARALRHPHVHARRRVVVRQEADEQRRAATGGLRRRHAGLDLVVELLRHLGGVKLRHAENCAGLSYRKARFYGRQRAGRAGRKAPKLFTAR